MFHHCSTVYCEQWEVVNIITIYQFKFYSEITNKTYVIKKMYLNENAVRIVLFVKSMFPKNITTSNVQRNLFLCHNNLHHLEMEKNITNATFLFLNRVQYYQS